MGHRKWLKNKRAQLWMDPGLENMRKIPLNEGVIVHKILEIPLGGLQIPC